MIGMNLRTIFIVPIFVLCFISELFGITIIKADHPNFQYNGRIDFAVPDKPTLFWPGTYIRANFEGPLIILMLDDKTGQSYYNVFIDEDYEHPHIIDCLAGSKIYLVSALLKDTVHSLLIFRRTEASTGPTKFLGIQINDGKTLIAPPARPEHKIVFYGNSITCGMGNEAPDNGADDNMAQENNFLAYGAVASRLLNADYMCIAKSGIGIMISWFPMVMSQYYYRLNPDSSASNWDFSQYTPDVVVINLFQNDSWLLTTRDSSKITNAYVTFVREIRLHHPNAFIVCALGSMDATKTGSPWPGYIEGAVQYMRNTDNDTNLGTYFFPFDPSWTKHPRVRHHLVMGQNLAAYINDKMGWTTEVENDSYAQLPNNFELSQNYPNPFNPTTKINYQLAKNSFVSMKIFDLLGNEITVLVNEEQVAGNYQITFDGSRLSSGVYFYKIQAGDFTVTKKLVLMK
ncbi:MAG: T9SS type A sorting domain-containing protein [Ignavibacteriaceae bacterium]|nr:T9SS type A sorting domain-containing protein [Ignavibacteriaceae bacterium]